MTDTQAKIDARAAAIAEEGYPPLPPNKGSYNRRGKKRTYGPINLTKSPSEAHLAANPHEGEAADHFTMYTPGQVDAETKNVRLDLTFEDVVKIRDQAEMIIGCMQEIIRTTREHKLGSIRQRIMARREADSLRRTMARFNGKCPHGDRYVPKDKR